MNAETMAGEFVGSATKAGYAARLRELFTQPLTGEFSWSMVGWRIQNGWYKVVDKLHLEKPLAYAAKGWAYVSKWGRFVGDGLGVAGGIGVAMAAGSTKSGRTVINKVIGAPARWLFRMGTKAHLAFISGLRHLWAPGNVAADLLVRFDEWQKDVYEATSRWSKAHLAAHLDVDGYTMHATRDIGIAMVGIKVSLMIPLLPVKVIGVAGFAIYGIISFVSNGSAGGLFGSKIATTIRINEETANLLAMAQKTNGKDFTVAERRVKWDELQVQATKTVAAERDEVALAKAAYKKATAKASNDRKMAKAEAKEAAVKAKAEAKAKTDQEAKEAFTPTAAGAASDNRRQESAA